MPTVDYLRPNSPLPEGRCVVVVASRDHRGTERGYFYDSAEGDGGDMGSFNSTLRLAINEAIAFATHNGIERIVVRPE